MGRVLTEMVNVDPEFTITAGIDINDRQQDQYPVFATCETIPATNEADVIIDYSHPAALASLLNYSQTRKLPLVLCATGYTTEQIKEIEKASAQIPIFRSGNMSLGINLLANLIKKACNILGDDFDIEIIERHHKRKLDAPSGTALMLAEAASENLPYKTEYIYERESRREPRKKQEIGISAVRGGTIVGTHEIIFAGQDETIELRHTASSRDIFATGTLKAAKFIINKNPGIYDMNDIFEQN